MKQSLSESLKNSSKILTDFSYSFLTENPYNFTENEQKEFIIQITKTEDKIFLEYKNTDTDMSFNQFVKLLTTDINFAFADFHKDMTISVEKRFKKRKKNRLSIGSVKF